MKILRAKQSLNDKGSALNAVLMLSLLVSLTLLIFLSVYVRQFHFANSTLRGTQAHYHAESGIIEWLHAMENYQTGSQQNTLQSTLLLSCGDSIAISSLRWGVFQRVYSREHKNANGIRATIGYAYAKQFNASLIVQPLNQSLIVCEDTRLYDRVICGPQGVRAQRLQGVPYSGEKPVYGKLYKSTLDHRPKVRHQQLKDIVRHYRKGISDWQHIQLQKNAISPENVIQLPQSKVLYKTDQLIDSKSPLTIIGPGKLLVTDASFFEQKLKIRNEVEVLISARCRIGSNVELQNVILFSTLPLSLKDVQASQLQIISTNEVIVEGNSSLGENSVVLSIPDEDGIGISIRDRVAISGSVCLVNSNNNPAAWNNTIQITRNARVEGLVFSDWLLNLGGTVNGCTIASRFHFYKSPTHFYNWIRNATIRQSSEALSGIPLFFDLPDSNRAVVYREEL
ncbi:MAG: hypothetical protein ACRBF0_08825 [Calditrichia bacterium]